MCARIRSRRAKRSRLGVNPVPGPCGLSVLRRGPRASVRPTVQGYELRVAAVNAAPAAVATLRAPGRRKLRNSGREADLRPHAIHRLRVRFRPKQEAEGPGHHIRRYVRHTRFRPVILLPVTRR